jgi:hypothetical protein
MYIDRTAEATPKTTEPNNKLKDLRQSPWYEHAPILSDMHAHPKKQGRYSVWSLAEYLPTSEQALRAPPAA